LGQQQLQRVILCPAFTIPQKITKIFQKMIGIFGRIYHVKYFSFEHFHRAGVDSGCCLPPLEIDALVLVAVAVGRSDPRLLLTRLLFSARHFTVM
jgi:hypothetical protein